MVSTPPLESVPLESAPLGSVPLESDEPENHLNLARTYLLSGMQPKALEAVCRGLEVDPNNAELKVTLGGTGQGAPTVDVTDDDSQGGTADTSGGGTSKKGGGCSTAESGEPSAPWLLLVGLIGLVVWRRRQRRDVVGESAGE